MVFYLLCHKHWHCDRSNCNRFKGFLQNGATLPSSSTKKCNQSWWQLLKSFRWPCPPATQDDNNKKFTKRNVSSETRRYAAIRLAASTSSLSQVSTLSFQSTSWSFNQLGQSWHFEMSVCLSALLRILKGSVPELLFSTFISDWVWAAVGVPAGWQGYE